MSRDPLRYHHAHRGKGAFGEVFSAVAYYSASMVMIAQKTQSRRELAREGADARHREDLAQSQLELITQNTELTEQVHQLTKEVHALVCTPSGDQPSSGSDS